MRQRGKIDTNHIDIRQFIRAHGVKWCDTSNVGNGFPDALLCWNDTLVLVEVKATRGALTPKQVTFHSDWPVQVIRTREDAAKLVQKMKETR